MAVPKNYKILNILKRRDKPRVYTLQEVLDNPTDCINIGTDKEICGGSVCTVIDKDGILNEYTVNEQVILPLYINKGWGNIIKNNRREKNGN